MGSSKPEESLEHVIMRIEYLGDEAERELNRIEKAYQELVGAIGNLEKELSKPELSEDLKKEFEKSLEVKRKQLEVFCRDVVPKLWLLKRCLEFGLKLENTKLLLGKTFRTYVLEGWVPEDMVDEVVEAVREASEGFSLFEVLKVEKKHVEDHGEEPPVFYKIPRFLKPFEKLVESYAIPSYYEINPTPIMALTFPILFGVMFADMGQAAILALSGLAFSVLRRKFEKTGVGISGLFGMILSAGELLLLCGLSGMFWGLLFGEIFGSHEIFGVHLHPIELARLGKEVRIGGFSPSEEIMDMFHLALFIGSIHLMLGLILSLVNKLTISEFKEALSTAFWIWFYGGTVYAVFTYGSSVAFDFGFWLSNPHLLIIPLASMMVVEGILRRTEGLSHSFMALIESMSHTVSYGRLLALTLIHASMSKMFLQIAPGVSGVIAGTLLSLMLEGIIIFVHALRLHWVEWFSKFYSGGEIKYTPFGIESDVRLYARR